MAMAASSQMERVELSDDPCRRRERCAGLVPVGADQDVILAFEGNAALFRFMLSPYRTQGRRPAPRGATGWGLVSDCGR